VILDQRNQPNQDYRLQRAENLSGHGLCEKDVARLLQAEGFAAEKVSRMYKPGADTCVLLLGTDGAIVATGFDTTASISEWGAEAQALGWTARELFALPDVPERPAANYDRLARLDGMGLVWLLRGRPVIVLTVTEIVTTVAIVTPAAAKIANAEIATPVVAVIATRATP
jgi:hypothetical protein